MGWGAEELVHKKARDERVDELVVNPSSVGEENEATAYRDVAVVDD